jgi:hypothetical protein
MIKSYLFATAIILASLFSMSGCGTSSSSSATATTLSAMPAATSAVSSSSVNYKLDLQTDATTGIALSAFNAASWTGKSGPMCEVGSSVIRLLSEAAQADKILCYVAAMETNGLFTSSYDGNNHFYTLAGAGGDGRQSRVDSTMKIKFNIASSGGAITNFKMWMCKDSARAYSQTEYVSTALSAGTATVTSVGVHTGSWGAGAQRTVATGGFNSNGTWDDKQIVHSHTFSGGTGGSAFSHNGAATLTQGSDSFTLSAYHNGYYGGSSSTQSGQLYAVIQGLNLGTLATAAFGSGSAKYSFTYSGGYGGTDTKSWMGDTRLAEASSTASYYTTVAAATLPTAATITTPSFAGTEIWDCSSGTDTFTALSLSSPTAAVTAAMTVCESKFGFSDNSMVDCHSGSY